MEFFLEDTMNKKAGFSIVGIIIVVLTLAVYSAFLPVLNEVIEDALPYLDPSAQIIISIIPFAMIIMILVGVIQYGQGQRQQEF